jgi:membrane-bound lytic murein transglycosylase D
MNILTGSRYSRVSQWLTAISLALIATACSTVPYVDPKADRPVSNAPANNVPTDSSLPVLETPSGLQPLGREVQTSSSAVAVPLPSKDLWDRIRADFAMRDLADPRVDKYIAFYAGKPDYIERMTTRSEKYLYYIVQALQDRQMPTELALLPFIESAFNPEALSRAKAAGMWQFMPATGRYFDLTQNVFRDERRDVLASTHAALDYLQKLHQMFGDWELALAAYNWGEGSVQRAIKRNQASGLGTSYSDLRMPDETRNYVPKLLAFKAIVADPARFRITLPKVPNHPFFDVVKIERDIDVSLAAKLASISEAEFRALNPSQKHPVILAAGLPRILLPWENAALFNSNLAAYTQPLASWTAWSVPRTANTRSLAKEIGMSENELRAVNGIPKQRLVKKGSVLVVRRHSGMTRDVPERIAENAQLDLRREVVYRRTRLQFKKGETVASVAKRYGISASRLALDNKLSTKTRLTANTGCMPPWRFEATTGTTRRTLHQARRPLPALSHAVKPKPFASPAATLGMVYRKSTASVWLS